MYICALVHVWLGNADFPNITDEGSYYCTATSNRITLSSLTAYLIGIYMYVSVLMIPSKYTKQYNTAHFVTPLFHMSCLISCLCMNVM